MLFYSFVKIRFLSIILQKVLCSSIARKAGTTELMENYHDFVRFNFKTNTSKTINEPSPSYLKLFMFKTVKIFTNLP